MSRVGGMLEALQSVADFRSTNVDGATISRGALEIDRFDIDDPLDRRRRYERGQAARGKKAESPDRSDVSGETDDGRARVGGEKIKSTKRHDRGKSRSRSNKEEKHERRAERKRAKREKVQKRRKEASDEDEGAAPRERGSDNKRRGRHSDRKEKSKRRSRHQPSSSSESEETSSSDAEQLGAHRKRNSERTRRQAEKEKSRRSKSRRQPSLSSGSEGVSHAEAVEGPAEKASSAEAVATAIVQKFSKVTGDLKLLLQTVDSGQAIDVSGLPNQSLATFLEKLFVSLNLTKLRDGVYSLPEGSRPTLETLASFFNKKHEGNNADEVHRPTPEDIGPTIPGPIGPAEIRRRVIGPAMPSSEMLAAAAKLTEAQAALREAEEELFRDPLVGPAPAAAVAEAESANEAERFEEVTRMMAKDVGDAYDVLGLKPDALPNNIKKRYWKLSLLVHPDKCSHPQAHEAFMKLNRSFKDLQDPVKRAEIDRKAKAKLEKEEYEAELKSRREAAQWRQLRGESPLSGDEELLNQGRKEPSRDTWMTALPPERQAGHTYTQTTAFSRSEKSGRGDTSAWTDTPLQKAEKAKMQYLEAYKQARIAADEGVVEKQRAQAAETAQLVDAYNEKKRPVPLVKKHKSKSAVKARNESKTENSWAENHPWKPWDRDKDLAAGRQAVKLDPEVQAQGLQSRFDSSGSTRSFL